MGFYDSVEISASGMSAERLAMDVIANNIANANTTRTPQGGAFKRQLIVFAQKSAAPGTTDNPGASNPGASGSQSAGASEASDDDWGGDSPFAPPPMPDPFGTSAPANIEGVQVQGIVNDQSPDRLVFDPGNPDADARGYVHYPNVEIVKEMVDLMSASRAYQANVAAITASNNMGASELGILKS
jgi:flagellar basal-body rod protein FlgC